MKIDVVRGLGTEKTVQRATCEQDAASAREAAHKPTMRLAKPLIIAVLVVIAGCTRATPRDEFVNTKGFAGSIDVCILQYDETRCSVHRFDPSARSSVVFNSTLPNVEGEYLGGGGHRLPRVDCGHGTYTVDTHNTQSVVIRSSVRNVMKRFEAEPTWTIRGAACSPDAGAVALLVEKHTTKVLGAKAILHLLAGHPIDLSAYRLELVSFDREERGEIVMGGKFEYAWASVQWH